MIFITLGTQDKGFPRLLDAVEKQIKNGNIKEEVIVQAGLTEYESKNMKIFDLVPQKEFDEYVNKANLIITHGGVGSILAGLKKGKTVIAAARLSKYKEHNNDHQLEIVKEFSKEGYILELEDFDKLDKVLEKTKTFKPKKYTSNTKNVENLVKNIIEEYDNTSWFNKFRLFIIPICFMILNIILTLLINLKLDLIVSSIISFIICIFIAFFSKESSYFDSFGSKLVNYIRYFICRIPYLVILVISVYLLNNNYNQSNLLSILYTNIILVIIAIIFNILYRNNKV